MPADKEIHLCVTGWPNVYSLAKSLGVALINSDDEDILEMSDFESYIYVDWENVTLQAINEKLKQAWIEAIHEKGWTIETTEDRYYHLNTPYGKRQAHPFELTLQYDIDEIGDEPEDMTFGVALSSRYFPCFLDMSNPHGTLGSSVTFENISDDIQIAKDKILKHVRELGDARVVLRDIFY